jgi:hypothetical protein
MPAFFAQDCPVCGRRLHIHASDAGKQVACQHCQGVFIAEASVQDGGSTGDWRTALVRRADELLALAAMRIDVAVAAG